MNVDYQKENEGAWALKVFLSAAGSTIVEMSVTGGLTLIPGLIVDVILTTICEVIPDTVTATKTFNCRPATLNYGQEAHVQYGVEAYRYYTQYTFYNDSNRDGVADGNAGDGQSLHIQEVRPFAVYTITTLGDGSVL